MAAVRIVPGLTRSLAAGLAFGAAALLGVALSRAGGNIAVFWPANGLLLGLLLRFPRGADRAGAVAASGVANVALNLALGDAPAVALGFALANMLEVLGACALLGRVAGTPFRLEGARELFAFLGAAGLLAPAAGATIGAALVHGAFAVPFWEVWHTWWLGDAIGMVLVAPVVAGGDDLRPIRRLLAGPRSWLAAADLAAAPLLLAAAAAFVAFVARDGSYGSPGLFAPGLLWSALRLGTNATAALALAVAVATDVAVVLGAWPMPYAPGATLAERMGPLQLFLVLTALPPLAVAAATAERGRLLREAAEAKRRLDDALEAIRDGFVLFDAEDRLVLCNQRWLDFFPRSRDVRVPGVSARAMWRDAALRGDYKGVDAANVDEWLAGKLRAYGTDGSPEIELADGRWLETRIGLTGGGERSVVVRDITERKRLERELERRATLDPLTGLANRGAFRLELDRAWARVERGGGRLAVLLVDLDRFKAVNDAHGHAAGDALLAEVGRRLQGCVREGDVVARLGGDEFAVLAAGWGGAGSFSALAERVVGRLAEPLRLGAATLLPGGTVGFAVHPDDGSGGAEELLARADRALYAAKAAGRGTWASWGGPRGAAGRGSRS